MSTTDRGELETISSTAYGKSHRLRLMMLMIESDADAMCQKDLVAVSGVGPATVKKLFDELAALNLIRPAPDQSLRGKYFVRVEGPGWAWARQLAVGLWNDDTVSGAWRLW